MQALVAADQFHECVLEVVLAGQRAQFLRGALGRHPPAGDDHDAIAERGDLLHDVAGEDHAAAFGAQLVQEAAQAAGELDPAVDMRTVVLLLWSMELGLGVIEALGLEPPDPDAWAGLTGRFIQSIEPPA